METDSALRAYRARARGHLYFLIDREDTGERTLVKADQIALDVFWRAPGDVRQRIVGRRDERRLPTTIRYHLDHLTVVTDDFDDRITLGDGDEVRSVLHPLAPDSERRYDFLLGDSLTIGFPGGREPVRVYEVRVRPRDFDEPGVVGSVYLDRASAAVVRMTLTFTPASYVDPYLDHIRISLDNGLWNGRFWLPYRQEVEIRRELPYLDFPAGSVIRGRYEIGDYVLNPDLPGGFFSGPTVTARPPSELESFPFEEGLYAEVEKEGLAPTPDLRDVRERAKQIAAERHLSGLRRLRLFAPSASSVFRYNRAEGVHVGGGASYRPGENLVLRVRGGHSFGRGRTDLMLELTGGRARPGTGIRAAWNRLRDLGPVPAASGTVNTLAAAMLERDYLDPYFASGVELFHRVQPREGPGLELTLRLEEHESAQNVLSADAGAGGPFRPVLPVDEGTSRALDVEIFGGSDRGLSATGRLTLGRFEDDGWAEAAGRVGWFRKWLASEVAVDADLRAGVLSAHAPLQTLYRLGGRGTLPGYGYRGYTGDSYWLGRVEASWGLAAPWVRPRALGAVGATGLSVHEPAPPWTGTPTPIPLFSAGVGVGLFWDVLRLDVARGLNGGGWEWNLSVNHTFWPYL